MKNDPVLAAIAALDEAQVRTQERHEQFAKALASKSNLVAAKAARIVGQSQWRELTGDLARAFERFRQQGARLDKGCTALTAIARALFALDYDDAELYLKGTKHVQMEAVWGGSTDTAAELRAVCAMGLAGTRHPHKLRELVPLLVDAQWQTRAGAVRAIATVGSEAASLLLRFKALSGDPEPEVQSDCFGSLIALEGAAGVQFVAGFGDESAILALGASRRADSVEWLIAKFGVVADFETKRSLLVGLAASRTDAAIGFLIGVIREGSARISEIAVAAMEVNRGDERLREAVQKALDEK